MTGRCLLKKGENLVIQLGAKLKRCLGDIVILHVVFANLLCLADLSLLGNAGCSHSVLMFLKTIGHMAHENKGLSMSQLNRDNRVLLAQKFANHTTNPCLDHHTAPHGMLHQQLLLLWLLLTHLALAYTYSILYQALSII